MKQLNYRLILLFIALTLPSCEVKFTPQITPLFLPTAAPQPFGTPISEQPDQPDLHVGEAEDHLLQEPENGDPLEWIEFIEGQWENVDVIACSNGEFEADCTEWTARELKLLNETLRDYILQDYLHGQIMFVRTEKERWSGLEISGVENGVLTSQIWISNSAWRDPPAAGFFDIFDRLFKKPKYFQGTIAHELTHSAIWFHPELLQWWITEKENYGLHIEKGDWRLGWQYDWSVYDEFMNDPVSYEKLIEGEFFAMSVAALMYDPFWKKGSR